MSAKEQPSYPGSQGVSFSILTTFDWDVLPCPFPLSSEHIAASWNLHVCFRNVSGSPAIVSSGPKRQEEIFIMKHAILQQKYKLRVKTAGKL